MCSWAPILLWVVAAGVSEENTSFTITDTLLSPRWPAIRPCRDRERFHLTAGTPENVTQTLSAYTFDLSIPASYRFAPAVALYGGPMLLRSGVSGSYGGVVGTDTYDDMGVNLGFQVTSGMFTGDLEVAELLVKDPFVDSSRWIPYVGIAFGVLF